jgi:phospholipid/cholesterol/gamma-HCH transport system substrate-binding protein
MSPATAREVRLGFLVLLTLGALFGFVALAGGGPGFLAPRRTVDVAFRDGQGLRVGCPVRVAGIDAGRVTAIELDAAPEGTLRARVRLSLPASLASRLRQDARITIQAGLTGQSCVNVVDSGRSPVALVPGQVIEGVESSFFDPVLQQVGLGPVERSHLSHTIAEVRATVDAAGPGLRGVLASLQEAVASLRETTDAAKPAVLAASGRLKEVAEGLDTAKLNTALARLDAITAEAEAMLAEGRPEVKRALAGANETIAGMKDLTGQARAAVAADVPKVDALLDGLAGTRVRLDRVLERSEVIAGQGAELLTSQRANLDRTVANAREASEYGSRLVQKLYGNPFYLSPFYKPTKEDVAAQEFYDTTATFLTGAKELKDAITSLQALRSKPIAEMTKAEQEAYQQLFNRAWALHGQLEQTSRQLAEGLRTSTRR